MSKRITTALRGHLHMSAVHTHLHGKFYSVILNIVLGALLLVYMVFCFLASPGLGEAGVLPTPLKQQKAGTVIVYRTACELVWEKCAITKERYNDEN